MTSPTREQVLDALKAIRDESAGQDIVSAGMVGGLTLKDGHVGLMIEVEPTAARTREPLRLAAERAVLALPGVSRATVILTAERPEAASRAPAPAKGKGAAQIRHIIGVASGKGGVGKSTVAVNLALALAHLGFKVGLLDADIYGPSVPRLLGLSGKPDSDGSMLQPMTAFGIKAMSIGLMVEQDTAMIWRGPMATSALQQMLGDVAWGALDILVVDYPPGTGDIQLTLAQRVPMAGAVIVSTPQDIALIDARKGLAMFRKVNVPVLGIIENMSYFLCPSCGTRSDIFGHGGARETARALDAPFLGEIPLHMAIRATSDAGTPIVASGPQSDQARAFIALAGAVADALAGADAPPAPTIRFS